MITKETAFKEISGLVQRFEEQIDSYKSNGYNETLTRRDFIDPFFKALGWDMDNSFGSAEAYREVVHEDKIKIGGATKAPDYSFKLPGGKRLFFVEAKKPSVDVKSEIQPAYQIRRYGWSAKMPISIITDFEEFAVYDCTKKPNIADKASKARIKYVTYKDYLKDFDFLWNTFSKEKVLKGSFDKFVQSDTNKKGTATVDKEFLLSLDQWRTLIAIDICKHNKNLNEDEINYAVQQTIDRLIFLRIAEDRNVEPYGSLKDCIKQGIYYNNLFGIFKNADDKYNSGLFDSKKDKISRDLVIDNKIIKTVINELYYPESPYEFSVLSVEILGSAYEQFLGRQISIDKLHKAKIEEKPEVRKAGGVYYTPQYIVDYIVKNTLGKLIEKKDPKAISKIKIIDPACGSGSFLLGAYQYLLDYHKDYYSDNGKIAATKKISQLTPEGNLTTSEKKRILLNNIFGVDIDVNAVEVTKLSLLLKCMEGETEASIATQLKLFHERILPTLDENIKSGNSLIDTDYYDGEIDFADEKKIKPFNWQKAFPDIFRQGGFDVAIGNPPYVMLQNLETRHTFNYAIIKYESAKYKIDTYQLFTEKALTILKESGYLGFITPNTFFKNIHSEPLRKYILTNSIIKQFVLFKYPVFSAASVDTCIFIFEKGKPNSKHELIVYQSQLPFELKEHGRLMQHSFQKNLRSDFNLLITDKDSATIKAILANSEPLKKYCDAYFGIQTFDRKKYVSDSLKSKNYKPVIDGWNIEPYKLAKAVEFVNFTPTSIKSGGNESIYIQDRICIRQIGAYPIATFVPSNIFTLNTVYNVYLRDKSFTDLRYLLGIINSSVTRFFWEKNNTDAKKTFPKIKKEAILSIPIPLIKTDLQKELKSEIIKNVSSLLKLNSESQSIKLQSTLAQFKSKSEYYIEKINHAVYKLYNFSEEEIEVIIK